MVLVLAALIWVALTRTRLGLSIKAIGSDAESALANGIDLRRVRFLSYTLAGAAYGWAGLAVAANTGSADPLIGAPMLLKIFAAVVLGGVVIGGGRGSAIGAIFGALTLTAITTVLLLSGIRTYYVPIVEGLILLGAVLLLSAGRDSPAVAVMRRRRFGGSPPPLVSRLRAVPAAAKQAFDLKARWRRVWPLLRFLMPPYALFVAALCVTAVLYGSGFSLAGFMATLLIFTTFLAILGLGQGAVVISGGLDLSLAWTITLPAVVLTAFANGSDVAATWAIPLALAIGAASADQWRPDRRLRLVAHHRDAGRRRGARGRNPGVQQRRANRVCAADPVALRQRQLVGLPPWSGFSCLWWCSVQRY